MARYALNEESSAYISFSRGYKSAIYNVGGHQDDPVKPEKINAYEIGYKFAGHDLSFDLASYYYDYSDLQVASYTFNPPASIVKNAATSRIYGLEGQLQYKVAMHWSINAGAAYTHAKYSEFDGSPTFTQCTDVAACGAGYGFFISGSQDEHNADMLRAPRFTGNLGSRYTLPLAQGELALSGNLYYTTRFYFDSSDTYYQKAYTLLGLRAEWTNPTHRYTIALYGDNVTNTHYLSQVLANNPGIGAYWGAPATFGGQVKVYF